MRIIPAIDIIGGKCVRLTRGDFSRKKVYNDNPVDVAKEIHDHGLKYLHVVDLDGARYRKPENLPVVEEIVKATNLNIDFGGGIRSAEDIRTLLNAGVKQVTGGSVAVKNRELFLSWLAEFGPDRIILGADSNNRKISASGWMEDSDFDVAEFITGFRRSGVKYAICTDIAVDGMLSGPATGLYKEILSLSDINLIASGGISSLDDLDALREAGCEGAIIGKAIYEGNITLKELGEYAEKKNNTLS